MHAQNVFSLIFYRLNVILVRYLTLNTSGHESKQRSRLFHDLASGSFSFNTNNSNNNIFIIINLVFASIEYLIYN